MSVHRDNDVFVFVGTYTRREPHVDGSAEGIYTYRLDLASGSLSYVATATGVVNPSYVAVDPSERYLYAVNEVAEYEGRASGAVSAFAIDSQQGTLHYLNSQLSHGAGPCHLSVDATGSALLVANYGGATISMLPIEKDGRLGSATSVIQHQGASVHPQRQQGPHPHAIIPDPTNQLALVADLGLDKILLYDLNLKEGSLAPHTQPWLQAQAGAGPRQLAFHPRGNYLYCINELDSTLTVLAYDAQQGRLQTLQTIATIPDTFAGTNTAADVRVAPSGRFVYASNRGHDTLAVFAVDEASGRLVQAGYVPTGGRTPRCFAIDPTGTVVVVANQDTSTVAVFHVDEATGQLIPTGHGVPIATPVCIRMIRRRS